MENKKKEDTRNRWQKLYDQKYEPKIREMYIREMYKSGEF